MQFHSIDFMLFFPVVVMIFFIIPSKLRSVWLLIASYYFYMSWNPQYAVLIALSTVLTYICGICVQKCSMIKSRNALVWKKIIVAACFTINLLILCIFKYGNFILESIDILMQHWNIQVMSRRFDLLLPVGISFYTFQALGYIIDVYREDIEAEHNLLRYALFVSFFPQLVAGPIERSENLLHQLRGTEHIRLWNLERVSSGAILMIWGFFMKMVIADRVSILVDTVFNNYRMYGSTELCLAAIGFAVQIYCDFGSYSLIAIGAAKIMGFTLMQNFDTPYLATSVKDFWSRWHISLSSWFKDYLYIPLGGSRHGKLRKAINKMLVFLVSGLWHGANWTFVAWGGIHGLYQIVADTLAPYKQQVYKKAKIKTACFSWKLLKIMSTFILVDIAWVFFRSDTIRDALRFFYRIILRPTPWLLFNGGIYTLGLDRVEMNILMFSLLILAAVEAVKYKKDMTLDHFLMEQNLWFRWTVTIVLVTMIFIYGEYGPAFDAQQFIYFQF